MGYKVFIDTVTGQSPYDVYVCNSNTQNCFFIDTFTSIPFEFIIPPPIDLSNNFCIKVQDNNNCVTVYCQNF